MRIRSLFAGLMTVAAAGMVFTGIGSTAAAASGGSLGNTAAVGLLPATSPNWFFPITTFAGCSTVNFQMELMMYKPLLQIAPNLTVNFKQSLATGITVSNNDTTYTVRLNPKWHWSNGTPVTSADVVWDAQLIEAAAKSSTFPYCAAGIGGVPSLWKSVTAQGRDTVVFQTTKSVSPEWFELNGLSQIMPVPKSVWNVRPNANAELTFISSVANQPGAKYYKVVDGPYKFQSMSTLQYWAFVPNPTYNGTKSKLSRVVFDYFTGASAEFSATKSGQINVAQIDATLVKSQSQLTNDVLNPVYQWQFDYAQINQSGKGPGVAKYFNQLYIREALQLGVDQMGMIKGLQDGYGVPTINAVPSEPPNSIYNKALKNPWPYNPAKGKKILEQHGWKMKNGVMTKNGVKFSFTFVYVTGTPVVKLEAELLKADWQKEGIQVNLKEYQFNTVIQDTSVAAGAASKWEINWWGAGWIYAPDYYPTGDGLLNTGGGANTGGVNDPHLNQLINATLLPGSVAQITQRMHAYEAYTAQTVPVLYLPLLPVFNEYAKNLKGGPQAFVPQYASWLFNHISISNH